MNKIVCYDCKNNYPNDNYLISKWFIMGLGWLWICKYCLKGRKDRNAI